MKGGTCLRFCFGLSRLSEDLDFDTEKTDFSLKQFTQDLRDYFVKTLKFDQLEIKTAAMENFYHRRLSLPEEMNWLKDQRIAYILYGPEEAEIAGGIADLNALYPALEKVFENKLVKIYKVPQK